MEKFIHLDRALIIRKNWLDLILSGEKTWEMRGHETKIRGRIGLIEAGSGLIVGDANLVGCHNLLDSSKYIESYEKHRVDDLLLLERWSCAWVLEGANRYHNPIHYDHPKGAVIWVKLND